MSEILGIIETVKYSSVKSKCIITLGGIVTALIGDITPSLVAIFILYCLDWMTGLLKSLPKKAKGVGSRPILRGLVKTLVYLVLVIVGFQLTKVTEPEALYKLALAVYGVIQFMIILTEGISIVENLDEWAESLGINLPVIDLVKDFLIQRRKKL